jgi:hypothetical protein
MMRAVNKLAAGISKSHIHLGTDEAASPQPVSPQPLSRQLSNVHLGDAIDKNQSNSKPSNAEI